MEDLVNARSFHASCLNVPPTSTYPASLQYQSPTQITTNLKGQWSDEEDRELVKLVNYYNIYKPGRWSEVSAEMTNRTGKQCRERWHNHLRPDIKKDAWSSEEESLLIRAHMKLGNQWSTIAKYIRGRTENSVKNYWNAAKRRILTKRKNNTMSGGKMSILEAYITSLPDSEDGYQTRSIDHQNNGAQNHAPSVATTNAVVVEANPAPLQPSHYYGGRAAPTSDDQMVNDFEFGYASGVNYHQNNGGQNHAPSVETTNAVVVEANTASSYPSPNFGGRATPTTGDQMLNDFGFGYPSGVNYHQNNGAQNYAPSVKTTNAVVVEANPAPLQPSHYCGGRATPTTDDQMVNDFEFGYTSGVNNHQNNGAQNHAPSVETTNAVVVEANPAPLQPSHYCGGRATPTTDDQMVNDFAFGYASGVNYQQNNGDQNHGLNLNVERTNMSFIEAKTTPLYPVSENGCQFAITTTDDQMVNNYLDEVNLPYIHHVDKFSYDVDQFIHPTSVYGRQNNCGDQNYTPNMEPVNIPFVEPNAAPLYPSSNGGWCPAAATAYDQTMVMNNNLLYNEVNIPLSGSDLLISSNNVYAPPGGTIEAVDNGCRFTINTNGQMVNNYVDKGDLFYLDQVDNFTTSAFDQFVYPTSVYQSQNNNGGQNYGPSNYVEPAVSMPVVEANTTPMYPSFDNGGFRAATTANGQMMLNNPLDFDLWTSNYYEPLDQTMVAVDDGSWWYGQRCDEVWNDQTEITF